jgi:hypothetical protein
MLDDPQRMRPWARRTVEVLVTLLAGFVVALILLTTGQSAILAVSLGIAVCIVLIAAVILWEWRHSRRPSSSSGPQTAPNPLVIATMQRIAELGQSYVTADALLASASAPTSAESDAAAQREKGMRAALEQATRTRAFNLVQLNQSERDCVVDWLLQVCAVQGWHRPSDPTFVVRNPTELGRLQWEWRPTGGTAYMIGSRDQAGLVALANACYSIAEELRDTPLGRDFRDNYKPTISASGII